MVTTSPQQFCVRWNSYQSNLQNAFPKLLTSEHFVDVTLACENEMLKCHKVVLSACSTYFEKLLLQNPCQHPIIFMKDMKFAEMQSLVDFMYKGEVNVTQDDLPSLLRSAEALQIRGLCGSDQLLGNNGQHSPGLTSNKMQQQNSHHHHHNQVKQAISAALNQHQPTSPTNGSLDKMTTLANAAAQHNSLHHHQQQQQPPQQNQPQPQQKVIPEPIPTNLHDLNHKQPTQPNKQQQQQPSTPQTTQQDKKDNPKVEDSNQMVADNSRSNTGSLSDCDEQSNDDERLQINIKEQTVDGEQDGEESYYEDMDTFMDDESPMTMAIRHNHREDTDDELKTSPDFAIANVSCQYADGGEGADGDYDHLTGLMSGSNMSGAPNSASNRRIRRSDEELRRAAECITRGQTFQTVSDQFNIPISTIRFYMARKGILPRRKRGRACAGQHGSNVGPTALTSPSQMAAAAAAYHSFSGAGQAGNASPPIGPPYHIVHYKLPQMGVSKLK